jgi:AcrR family transcriptional regulator
MSVKEEASVEHEPRVRNRRGEGERLRSELVAAAGQLLDETGSEDALSMRAVTRAVGAAPQSIYAHFTSKDELLWAVYAERWDEIATALQAAAETAGADPAARLRARCEAYCGYALAHPGQFRSLVSATGSAPPQWKPPLPGTAVLTALDKDVRACTRETETESFTTTVCLAGALNGILQLHLNRGLFGWPELPALLDRLLGRLVTMDWVPGSGVEEQS